jgi:hypothetical protein
VPKGTVAAHGGVVHRGTVLRIVIGLYVADTAMNRITRISHAPVRHASAGTGTALTSGGKLNGPLGMTIAPNGDVLTVNGNNGRIVAALRPGA